MKPYLDGSGLCPAPPPHAALQALLQFQIQHAGASLPGRTAAQHEQALALFPTWCVQREFGRLWAAADQVLWQRAAGALVQHAAALPVAVALRLESVAPSEAGPLLWDVATCLRGDAVPEDETQELDAAIRWWQGARQAGLQVDADFGECWRSIEWLGLQQQLAGAGLRCQQHHADDRHVETDAASEAHRARLVRQLAGASKVALRYGPLKPLLRLLQPLQGDALAAGYTF